MTRTIGGAILALGCCLQGASVLASPRSVATEVRCTATGSKYFEPTASTEQICSRFATALESATGKPMVIASGSSSGIGLRVELRFLAQGVASAKVTSPKDTKSQPLPLQELAVSDRRFNLSDVDRLAADTARSMRTMTQGQRG